MAKRKPGKLTLRPYSSFQTTCLEDPDNDYCQVRFTGRAFQLRTWGYPVGGYIEALVDGDIDGSTIDAEPPSGTATVATYNSSNGNWTHIFHQVLCDPDPDLPATEVVIKNFIVWWKYQKGTTTVLTYWRTEIIRVPMPPCVHLGICPTFLTASDDAKYKPAKKKSR